MRINLALSNRGAPWIVRNGAENTVGSYLFFVSKFLIFSVFLSSHK